MPRVLLVDDEPDLLMAVGYSIRRAGFEVTTVADGLAAVNLVDRVRPDIVILDVMLPGIDGFEVCRQIRARMGVPILMLTARDDPVDRVVGLEVGADDYITKPFSVRELVARIRAHLRRETLLRAVPTHQPAEPAPAAGGSSIGDLTIDPARRTATLRGKVLPLRRREFDLLAHLGRNTGITLSRRHLLQAVWNNEVAAGSRTIDVHIRRLRRHLGDDERAPRYLHTVRGRGYVLRLAPPLAAPDMPLPARQRATLTADSPRVKRSFTAAP